GTPAEHAQLYFRLKKAEVQCMACFGKYQPVDGKIHCPYCGSYGAKILSGEEFDLESIELDPEKK
ncbi:MAG: hydrogenase maturation nickel metallochaperone HypA, partial [Syntrophothermus sp.]